MVLLTNRFGSAGLVTLMLPGTAVPVLLLAAVAVSAAAAAILFGSVIATAKLEAPLRLGWMRKLSPAAATPPPSTSFRPPAWNGLAAVPLPLMLTLAPLLSRRLHALPS